MVSLLRSGTPRALKSSSDGAKMVNPLSAVDWNVLITPLETINDANVLHPAFSMSAVMLTSDDGAGAVRIPGAIIGALISRTEMLYGICLTDLV